MFLNEMEEKLIKVFKEIREYSGDYLEAKINNKFFYVFYDYYKKKYYIKIKEIKEEIKEVVRNE